MKKVTPPQLRANIYNFLDEVWETGIPLEIKKGNRKLRIIPVDEVEKLKILITTVNR